MLIVGAGMAGCLAGTMYPNAKIIEAADSFQRNHDAVLRFRDDSVSKQVGIPFKKVKVHKAIYTSHGGFVQPNIRFANWYSMKVTHGKISDRSIWNLEPSTRYVAPSEFHEMLEDMCHDRITYGESFGATPNSLHDCVISTIPMNKLMEILDYQVDCEFEHWPIKVDRFKVVDCDVHQTVYFPELNEPVYRMTLTGDDLIIESMIMPNVLVHGDNEQRMKGLARDVFGFGSGWLHSHIESNQRYGKIRPIHDDIRKRFMYWATKRHNIYSLGRYATWRNILMDDVLDDILKIRAMMNSSEYEMVRSLI